MSELLASLTQETRLLRLSTPLGADTLVVECLRGEEGVSQCYALNLTVLSTQSDIALKSLLGQPALLELATALSDTPRAFHGHITDVSMLGADGGLARYALTISPWYAFLRHGRDSRVFQDQTVLDILSALFASWQNLGTLSPDWRFDVRDAGAYPLRSLTCQYQESNFDFAERLMREEGLFYYFQHSGDPDSERLGHHVMVIADHNGSFQPNAQALLRFSQPGAVMRDDTVDRWRTALRWTPDALEIASWDYRTNSTRPVAASGELSGDLPLTSRDTPGAYAYPSREQGQRIADQQRQALEVQRETHVGAGTVRGNRKTACTRSAPPRASVRCTATGSTPSAATCPTAAATSTATAACSIPSRPRAASRAPSSSARPAPSCTPTATTVSRCSSTGNAASRATAA